MAFFKWLPSESNLSRQSIQTRILNDPYYRLKSAQEVAIAATLGVKIDVNQASVDDWLRLPGISIHQARSLVQLTQSGVEFLCLEDIAAALGLSVATLKPLEPILKFYYYDAESEFTPQTVNVNTASIEQLTQIPGFDLRLATALIQDRLSAGRYRNLVDFQHRLSLSGKVIAQLMYYLRF